jgi:hypothetical protein
MKVISLTIAVFLFLCSSFVGVEGNNHGIQQVIKTESYLDLTDTVVKAEMALFSIKASESERISSNANLREIILKKCSDSAVFFRFGDLYSSALIVSLVSESEDSKKRLKTIELIYGRYGRYFLPEEAFADLQYPVFCEKYTKRGKPLKHRCKVFWSEDKKRVYVYMLNGDGKNNYEVTWVI